LKTKTRTLKIPFSINIVTIVKLDIFMFYRYKRPAIFVIISKLNEKEDGKYR
jgi:hypothetical protein